MTRAAWLTCDDKMQENTCQIYLQALSELLVGDWYKELDQLYNIRLVYYTLPKIGQNMFVLNAIKLSITSTGILRDCDIVGFILLIY